MQITNKGLRKSQHILTILNNKAPVICFDTDYMSIHPTICDGGIP